MENGHWLYNSNYQLDKDQKGGNIYSPENCVVMLRKENEELKLKNSARKLLPLKDNERLEFESISEASRQLGISRASIQAYLYSHIKYL